MKLRFKVLSGFIVLALMLSAAGVWSVLEMRSISSAVQDLLADNYRSIDAAKTMLEALEREDSGILLLVLGQWREGRGIVAAADSVFQDAFRTAAGNVTIPGEDAHIAAIASAYAAYKRAWEQPIVETPRQGNLTWYLESVNGPFLEVKNAVSDLMTLNDRAMFETASTLRNQANRAVMPGVVAIVAALVFSLMFSYFVNRYVVDPIVRITDGVRQAMSGQGAFDVPVAGKDELSDLVACVRTLVARMEKPDEPGGGNP
jgi:HAMP domain-containing protein